MLPASPGLLRKAFDLQRYGTWRELQFLINTNSDTSVPTGGKLAIRSIRITFFMDTMRLQTIPNTGVLEAPVELPDIPMTTHLPTTLMEDAQRYAEFIVNNYPAAKEWDDPVMKAAWYISHGFAAAVIGERGNCGATGRAIGGASGAGGAALLLQRGRDVPAR